MRPEDLDTAGALHAELKRTEAFLGAVRDGGALVILVTDAAGRHHYAAVDQDAFRPVLADQVSVCADELRAQLRALGVEP